MRNQRRETVLTALHKSLPNTDHGPSELSTASPAAHVRAIGVELMEGGHAYIHRKLHMKLRKFTTSIQRISVRVSDLNGPRGGVDQVCSIKVVLTGLPSVVVNRRHASLQAAIDAAVHAIEQAVRGIVGRRRMKPLRDRPAWARDAGL